jgi:hypothetical protein
MRTLIAVFLLVCTGAGADTFTNIETGQTLEGKLLGTIIEQGKRIYLVKVGRDHRKLEEDLWNVKLTPPPGDDYEWKPTIYKNEVRDIEWLKSAYRSRRRDFTMIGTLPIDLRQPVAENELHSGRRLRLRGLVRDIFDDGGILLLVEMQDGSGKKSAHELHVLRAAGKRDAVNRGWSGTVVRTEAGHRVRLKGYRPSPRERKIETAYILFPKELEPLTPAQFMKLIERGFDFDPPEPSTGIRPRGWVTCPRCKGKGKVRGIVKKISGGIYEYYEKVIDCPRCGGRGSVYR